MSLPVALQLFSVRQAFSADPLRTLEKVREMGYDGVEFAGLFTFKDDARALRYELDHIGLRAISAHVPFAELWGDTDKVIENYGVLGCEYVAIPWLDAKTMLTKETIGDTLEKVKVIGKKLSDAGITLLYHNHNFEFEKIDGKYIIDIIYSEVSADLLKTELDTCWVNVGGEDPAAFIRKYAGRSPVVHLKDFVGGGKEGLFELIGKKTEVRENKAEFDFRPVGYGVQDFKSILSASLDAGSKWVVVEQDRSSERDPLDACRMSREYLRTLGW